MREGYAAGELKHGPIALVDENLITVVIAPKDKCYDKVLSNLQEIKARGGKIIAIGNTGDHKIGKPFLTNLFLLLIQPGLLLPS